MKSKYMLSDYNMLDFVACLKRKKMLVHLD